MALALAMGSPEMKQFLRLPICLLALVLGTGIAAMIITNQIHQTPLYTVAEVQAHLARSPAAWVGRTVRMPGVAVPPGCVLRESMLCVAESSYLAYLVDPTRFALLPLTRGASNPLLALARRVPVLDGLAPAPQVVQWGVVATYRVRLRAMPHGLCGTTTCYEALLVDAAPGSLWEGGGR